MCIIRKFVSLNKLYIFLILFVVNVYVYFFVFDDVRDEAVRQNPDDFYESGIVKNYLIHNSKCSMPNLDPWTHEAHKFIAYLPHVKCSKKGLLTYIKKNETVAYLSVNKSAEESYTKNGVRCCVSYVTRRKSKEPDKDISVAKCLDFNDTVQLTGNVILVKCYDKRFKIEVYKNTHAFTLLSDEIRNRSVNINKNLRPLSVLFVGIDSISRLNFQRTLPSTLRFLRSSGWIEYVGYNKVGRNTYPNVLAILSGLSPGTVYGVYDPNRKFIDDCDLIWKRFREFGYVTAYAEDWASINTFNYLKKGFMTEPVDFYFRHYTLASEMLSLTKYDSGMPYCTGPEIYPKRIMNLATDFVTTFRERPSFGFFWMSTFSHNNLNSPCRMDNRLREFFENLEKSGALNDTIVIFVSDHGIRFGPIRYTLTGWLEERLPFAFFRLPISFRLRFPQQYANFRKNALRLTTPYDLHMTLQHILSMSGFNYTARPSEGCPNCTSLFRSVEEVRSCQDAGIPFQWCGCIGYKYFNPESSVSRAAANFILEKLHSRIKNHTEDAYKCSTYRLARVLFARISDTDVTFKNHSYLLIMFETYPNAKLEGTVSFTFEDNEPVFEMVGGLNRIDSYRETSYCVEDAYLKEFCYCHFSFSSILHFLRLL